MFESEAHIERGSPRPAAKAGGNLVGRGIANPQELPSCSFESYLKVLKKRNIKQILCYAQRYHSVLEIGDATPLVNLSSGAVRRHAMEGLAAWSKYNGCYDRWQEIRKRYSLKWTDGNESLQSLQRFFNPDLSLDVMLQRIHLMIEKTPTWAGNTIKFACLVGLRPSEVLESVRLLLKDDGQGSQIQEPYYNPERQALEHFRFPDIFIRQTKKAYISYVTLTTCSLLSI